LIDQLISSGMTKIMSNGHFELFIFFLKEGHRSKVVFKQMSCVCEFVERRYYGRESHPIPGFSSRVGSVLTYRRSTF
jgi:hypothetical protein